jgi:hypothetical protein
MDNLTHDEHLRAEGALNALEIAGVRIKELEAQLATLKWTNIDAEHLPKLGDEVCRGLVVRGTQNKLTGRWACAAVNECMELSDLFGWTAMRWTHYRPINPPQIEGDGE